MSSFRRTCVLLLGVAGLAALALLPAAYGQPKRPPLPGPGIDAPPQPDGFGDGSLTVNLPGDQKLQGRLKSAEDNINAEDWPKAVAILQSLLNIPEDKFVQVERTTPDGRRNKVHVSVRKEANRLLGSLPQAGRDQYKSDFGGEAKALLTEAKQQGDLSKLAKVAERYLYTDSGAEATLLLASHQLDRGQFVNAALWFDRLIEREGLNGLSDKTLLKAALALHAMKDKHSQDLEAKVWAQLRDKVGGSMRVGDRVVDLDDLKNETEKIKVAQAEYGKFDWAMPRGNPSRNAVAEGGAPFLGPRWKQATAHAAGTQTLLKQAAAAYASRGGVIIPATCPIAVDGKLVYRCTDGIWAVNLKDGSTLWNTETVPWNLDNMVGEGQKFSAVKQWADAFSGGGKSNVVLENSTIGTLSTDNAFVYAVEDLPVPPYTNPFQQPLPQSHPGVPQDRVEGNRLQAYHLNSGKLVWELGGKPEKKDNEKKAADDTDLSNTYFLGPPLPIHGKLYVLTENNKPDVNKRQELRLICIESKASGSGATPEIVWTQALASTVVPLQQDPDRRIHAAHLAYGEGVLVCPTNSGALLAVDYLTHSLVWAYGYRQRQPGMNNPNQPFPGGPVPVPNPGFPGQPGMRTGSPATEWKASAPIIVDGKVVFTAFDASAVHCLNLHDGTEVWKVEKKDDDVYLAGVQNGKVVIVGKKYCRALDLNNKGNELWNVPTGTPSGLGVFADNVFYLPLKAPVGGKDPEVCQIDIDNGKAIAHSKSRKKEVAGNLLFFEGDVVSQSLDEVVNFPQLKVRLDEMNAKLAKNEKDPEGLMQRGEVNLDRGDHKAAVADLQQALANNPDDAVRRKARETLYDCLTEYLQTKFPEAEQYLAVYKDLCKVEPAEGTTAEQAARETKKRQAAMYSLVGHGKELQYEKDNDPKKLLDAFDAYLAFGSLGVEGNELMPVVYDTSIQAPLDVLARAQITALMAKAAATGQQKPLEERIAARWNDIVKDPKTDIDAVRGFVGLFGAQSSVGRRARLQLAEMLMESADPSTLPLAEQQLLLLRRQTDEPEVAAQAVEALARLMARKTSDKNDLMRDAAYYYRVLATEFPKVVVRDGKTGEDFYNELITDKRFWGYLDEGPQSWAGAKVQGKQEYGQFPQNRQFITFEPVGELTPFLQRFQVTFELQFFQLVVKDRVTGEEVFKENLAARTPQLQNFFFMALNNGQQSRFTYQAVGHQIVVPLGYMVYCIDLVNRRRAWEPRNLLGEGGVVGDNVQLMTDPADGSLQLIYPDGVRRRIGRAGPIEPAYVCLQAPEGLTAVDPVTGRTLWVRSDVTARSTLFGDDQVVYVVDVNDQTNQPTGTKALRAQDGAQLNAPDFKDLFQQKQRLIGRTMLLSETKNNKTVLRLYDVTLGKDVWSHDFPANTTILRPEEPHLAGGVDPTGKVTVFDLRTKKEVLTGSMDPKHLEKNQGVSLLEDAANYYVAVNGPPDQVAQQFGGTRSTFQPIAGVRQVPVNGAVYAFAKDGSGKLRWRVELPGQMLILDHFNDLPVLLFAAMTAKKNGQQWTQATAVTAVYKTTGKLAADAELMPNNIQQFYALNMDLKAGKIEMVSWGFKYTLTMEAQGASGGGGGDKEKDKGPGSGPGAPPGPLPRR